MLKIDLRSGFTAFAIALCFLSTSTQSRAQASNAQSDAIALHRQGHVEVPSSSIRRPEDAGLRAHTNVLIWRDSIPRVPGPQVLNSQPSSTYETPASIACVYNLVTQVPGCPIASTTALPTGGTGAIAIVDAYDDPDAASDLATFSSYFNLPQPNFKVVYASGFQPPVDTYDPATGGSGGWELEESLDIEWAHAMAPSAQIILVEANSNSYSDLMQAETVAGQLVSQAGGGVVSNSWGGAEFTSESSYDSDFAAINVMFTASTGDYALQVEYPSVSPNVVAVGGTSLSRDGSGNFIGESYWNGPNGEGGGGGLSQYEAVPSYQNTIQSIVGAQRGVPDLSSDADPESGVAMYDSFPYSQNSYTSPAQEGWVQEGGTSLSSPTIAGRANASGIFLSTRTLQNNIYGEYGAGTAYPTNFRDITTGASPCVLDWDFCSGIGSPLSNNWTAGPPQLTRYYPASYTDIGGDPTSLPTAPFTGQDAYVQAFTTYNPPSYEPADTANGDCIWYRFPSHIDSNNLTLHIPYSTTSQDPDDEFPIFEITATVNGTPTTLGPGTVSTVHSSGEYTVTVPAGTDLSSIQVEASAETLGDNGGGNPYDDVFVQIALHMYVQ